ncbi:magnesium transporter [Bartonella sp. HY329]|uniref:magnesium transporter n=1 Tax=unclassified Bartonella TaxID=2645622 RepID=UPI0021C64B22|nr:MULTISPECIES: magnesium transporter [unclassified Bartonella]UXM94957.1 magnesium transporter [Bartonella sp. HY329]UXN09280.1 magnesium transporter [Bartonella sp. HY328]
MTEPTDKTDSIASLAPWVIATELVRLRYADAIDVINSLEIDEAVEVFIHLPLDYAVDLFDMHELQRASEIMEALPTNLAVDILDGMSADEATDVFQDMDEEVRKRLFSMLEPVTRHELKTLTLYPENTAGALMTTEFISVPATWTVERSLNFIREVERTRETVYTTYVIDPESGILLRDVSLRDLVLAHPSELILEAGRHQEPVTISPLTERDDVARLFRRYDLLSVPVVDDEKHVIGIVTVDDVLDVMVDDMSEDAQKFGGMEAIDEPYMQTSIWEMFKKRGGWLAILLIGEMFTTTALQFFDDEFKKASVLVFFIPLIISSGGNSGSQATSLIIRALALREVTLRDWWKIFFRELPTGLILGALLGVIGLVRIIVWQFSGFYDYGPHWFLIAVTIFFTLIAVVTFGSLTGSLLPFLLKRVGFDPASASAPLVATLVDVSGIVIYFSIAALILTGTLL